MRTLFCFPQLCLIVPGQRYTRRLSENQVTNMLRATCQRPMERESNIQQVGMCFMSTKSGFLHLILVKNCSNLALCAYIGNMYY